MPLVAVPDVDSRVVDRGRLHMRELLREPVTNIAHGSTEATGAIARLTRASHSHKEERGARWRRRLRWLQRTARVVHADIHRHGVKPHGRVRGARRAIARTGHEVELAIDSTPSLIGCPSCCQRARSKNSFLFPLKSALIVRKLPQQSKKPRKVGDCLILFHFY